PADQAAIVLVPVPPVGTQLASVVFSWATTTAEDGGLVLYEIVFDKESGDFSKPVYKAVSDNGGVNTQVTLTHQDLAKIADAGGIGPSSTGKLKWSVLASKATNKKVATASRIIQLTRPAGFTNLPATLFLTGTASEGGNDITKAVALKRTAAGAFELFTSLTAGSYQLSETNTAAGRKFYVDDAGVIKEGTAATTVAGTAKAFRLRYDFNVATSQTAEVTYIGIFQSGPNNEIGRLAYTGNSTWVSPIIPIVFFQFPGFRDERYKFIIHLSSGNEYYGSTNANNNGPVGQPAPYFYVVPVNNSQFDFTYKLPPASDNHRAQITMLLQPASPYTHSVAVFN
ncbi:MAG: hypothetical protein EOP41_09100, partial [Sphingobacteriaceae bacterium]